MTRRYSLAGSITKKTRIKYIKAFLFICKIASSKLQNSIFFFSKLDNNTHWNISCFLPSFPSQLHFTLLANASLWETRQICPAGPCNKISRLDIYRVNWFLLSAVGTCFNITKPVRFTHSQKESKSREKKTLASWTFFTLLRFLPLFLYPLFVNFYLRMGVEIPWGSCCFHHHHFHFSSLNVSSYLKYVYLWVDISHFFTLVPNAQLPPQLFKITHIYYTTTDAQLQSWFSAVGPTQNFLGCKTEYYYISSGAASIIKANF